MIGKHMTMTWWWLLFKSHNNQQNCLNIRRLSYSPPSVYFYMRLYLYCRRLFYAVLSNILFKIVYRNYFYFFIISSLRRWAIQKKKKKTRTAPRRAQRTTGKRVSRAVRLDRDREWGWMIEGNLEWIVLFELGLGFRREEEWIGRLVEWGWDIQRKQQWQWRWTG